MEISQDAPVCGFLAGKLSGARLLLACRGEGGTRLAEGRLVIENDKDAFARVAQSATGSGMMYGVGLKNGVVRKADSELSGTDSGSV